MKPSFWRVFLVIFLTSTLLILFSTPAYAASPSSVVIGNSYTLDSGQFLNDDLFVVGGSVNLKTGSVVNGNIILLGGSLQAAGKVNGDITILGGTLNLASTLILNGNLTTTGTAVSQESGAQINGQVRTGGETPGTVIPFNTQVAPDNTIADFFLKVSGYFLGLILWTLVAMVTAMFIPAHIQRVTQAGITQPVISGLLGLLTAVVSPILLILLSITILLIPVAFLGVLLLVIAWAYGIVALGSEVGRRIGLFINQSWHPALTTGLGTLVLMAVLGGLQTFIPCIGWIPEVLVGFVGLGAVLLTRFGMMTYTPTSSLPAVNNTGTPAV